MKRCVAVHHVCMAIRRKRATGRKLVTSKAAQVKGSPKVAPVVARPGTPPLLKK